MAFLGLLTEIVRYYRARVRPGLTQFIYADIVYIGTFGQVKQLQHQGGSGVKGDMALASMR